MPDMHTGKILVVDDTPANIALLTKILEKKGHRISAASDGERAIKVATYILPDLILLDIMMPGIDGYETCRRLKASRKTGDIPIIFISAKIEIEDLLMGFTVGGVDYIHKPFHEEEVCARIQNQIQIQVLHKELSSSELKMSQLLVNYQHQSERLQQIVNHVVDGILEISATGIIQFANPAVEQLFEYSAEELRTINFTDLLAEPFATQYKALITNKDCLSGKKIIEITGKRKNGSEFPIDFSFLRIPGSDETCLAVIHDIAMHKDKEAELRYLSNIDALTNLANRRRFNECFAQEWQRGQRNKNLIAFIMIDIDYFKQFNDTYGHQAGDACLVNVATSMKSNIKRPTDMLARIGGEEFAIILPETQKTGVIQIAEQVRKDIQALEIPHRESHYGVVTISLGIAITAIDDQCHSSNALYQIADEALYQAKQSGRNQYALS